MASSSRVPLLPLVLLCCLGCEPRGEALPADGIAVLDDLGRLVTLEEPPRRIASLAPGFTETLFAVGCGDRIVVRDRWSDHPPRAGSIPAVDGISPAAQPVAGFEPDLVLFYGAGLGQVAPLERLGIRVAVFNPATFEEVADTISRIGVLAGCEEAARALAAEMLLEKERVSGARTGGGPLVYVEIDGTDPARPWTAGPGSFVHELLDLAGARNAAIDVRAPYAQVGAEALIRADPDWVLLLDVEAGEKGSAARLASRSGWGGLAAVREGRVIDWIDRDLVSRPGPRLAEGLRLLAEALPR